MLANAAAAQLQNILQHNPPINNAQNPQPNANAMPLVPYQGANAALHLPKQIPRFILQNNQRNWVDLQFHLGVPRLIQNNNPSEEELRQRLLQRYPGGIQPRNNAQQNENELRQRLLQRYPRGIAKRVNVQAQNNPPPPQNEPPPAPQQPGIVQSNDFPRGRDRSRTKNDLPRNNLNPQIQNVAVAAPVVANQAFEYPAFLKEHHPHRWNKTSFSFKEPPETIRPYYFIDRYFNHIRNPANLAISQSTLPDAGLGLFAFLPNNLKINGHKQLFL